MVTVPRPLPGGGTDELDALATGALMGSASLAWLACPLFLSLVSLQPQCANCSIRTSRRIAGVKRAARAFISLSIGPSPPLLPDLGISRTNFISCCSLHRSCPVRKTTCLARHTSCTIHSLVKYILPHSSTQSAYCGSCFAKSNPTFASRSKYLNPMVQDSSKHGLSGEETSLCHDTMPIQLTTTTAS